MSTVKHMIVVFIQLDEGSQGDIPPQESVSALRVLCNFLNLHVDKCWAVCGISSNCFVDATMLTSPFLVEHKSVGRKYANDMLVPRIFPESDLNLEI